MDINDSGAASYSLCTFGVYVCVPGTPKSINKNLLNKTHTHTQANIQINIVRGFENGGNVHTLHRNVI